MINKKIPKITGLIFLVLSTLLFFAFMIYKIYILDTNNFDQGDNQVINFFSTTLLLISAPSKILEFFYASIQSSVTGFIPVSIDTVIRLILCATGAYVEGLFIGTLIFWILEKKEQEVIAPAPVKSTWVRNFKRIGIYIILELIILILLGFYLEARKPGWGMLGIIIFAPFILIFTIIYLIIADTLFRRWLGNSKKEAVILAIGILMFVVTMYCLIKFIN